jgi:hypothetical protein
MEAQFGEVLKQDLGALAPAGSLPPQMAKQKFPPLFVVEAEYRLALIRAELDFVNELIRRIVDEGWGPVAMWRDVQAAAARQHEKQET